MKTILVVSHEHNTFDKRELLKNINNDYVLTLQCTKCPLAAILDAILNSKSCPPMTGCHHSDSSTVQSCQQENAKTFCIDANARSSADSAGLLG